MPEYLGLCAGTMGLIDVHCCALDQEAARSACAEYAQAPCIYLAPTTLPIFWVTYNGRTVEVAAHDAAAAAAVVTDALKGLVSRIDNVIVEPDPTIHPSTKT